MRSNRRYWQSCFRSRCTFELSVDELEEVVLFAEQPAANSNAAAKLILKITLFSS